MSDNMMAGGRPVGRAFRLGGSVRSEELGVARGRRGVPDWKNGDSSETPVVIEFANRGSRCARMTFRR